MEEEKEFACRRVLGLVSEYLFFKEGILPPEGLSDLRKEVCGIIADDDSKNHDDEVAVQVVSECHNINVGGSCSENENENEEAVLSECNNINIGGSSSFDSDHMTMRRESKKERKASPSKKHNNTGVCKKSLKRRAKKKRSARPSPSKKHKNNYDSNDSDNSVVEQQQQQQPEPAAELPVAFRERIEEMEGVEVKLVIEKQLTKSDLNANNGRFSIPKGKIRENFLTAVEEYSLDVRELKGKKERLTGMPVSLLDPALRLCDDMCFKKWEMDTTDVYNITRGWNHVVAENNLRPNHRVQLWSFRCHNHLHFALVKL